MNHFHSLSISQWCGPTIKYCESGPVLLHNSGEVKEGQYWSVFISYMFTSQLWGARYGCLSLFIEKYLMLIGNFPQNTLLYLKGTYHANFCPSFILLWLKCMIFLVFWKKNIYKYALYRYGPTLYYYNVAW